MVSLVAVVSGLSVVLVDHPGAVATLWVAAAVICACRTRICRPYELGRWGRPAAHGKFGSKTHLTAKLGYDYPPAEIVTSACIRHRIGRKKNESSQRRWTLERAMAWLACRRSTDATNAAVQVLLRHARPGLRADGVSPPR